MLMVLFLDHRSSIIALILALQDSLDVTLACVDVVVSNCSLSRATLTEGLPAALALGPPALDPRILVAALW